MAISRYTAAAPVSGKLKLDPDMMSALKGLTPDDEEDPAAPPSTKAGSLAATAASATGTARGTSINPTGRAPDAAPATQTYGRVYDPEDTNMDGIVSLQEKQAAETKAAQDDLAASKAQQLQQAQAKANLGGLGLSGAAASEQGDITRTADRTATETLADLRQKQADETFQTQQRQAAIWDQETADGVDLDHDGYVGPPPSATGKTTDQYNAERTEAKRQDLATQLESNNAGIDLWMWDPDNPPGSIERPYVISGSKRAEMEAAGFEFKPQKASGVPRVGGGWGETVVYRDNDGKYWYFE